MQRKFAYVWRSRASGELVVHPMALYGQGAFEYPAPPLRLLPSTVQPATVGETILGALARAGRVDWDFRDWQSYWNTADDESVRLFTALGYREKPWPSRLKAPISLAEVAQTPSGWSVTEFSAISPSKFKPGSVRRVSSSAGVAGLADAVFGAHGVVTDSKTEQSSPPKEPERKKRQPQTKAKGAATRKAQTRKKRKGA